MSVMIRFSRAGTNNRPFYNIVVADKKASRDGKYLERLGTYNPLVPEAKRLSLNVESFMNWVKKGAQVSATVSRRVKAVVNQK